MRSVAFGFQDCATVRRCPPVSIAGITRAVVVWAALWAGGCRLSQPPEFRLNLEGRDPDEITLVQTDALTETLADLFGTPDSPAIPEGVGCCGKRAGLPVRRRHAGFG